MASRNFNRNSNNVLSENEICRYVLERFDVVKDNPKFHRLVDFHTKNKYLIMVHNQDSLKKLGNLVANHSQESVLSVIQQYEFHLKKSLLCTPTGTRHLNAIMHIFGYFSKNFNSSQKDLFTCLVKQYRDNQITIGNLLAEISPLVYLFNNTYLANQTYFLLYSEKRNGTLFSIL